MATGQLFRRCASSGSGLCCDWALALDVAHDQPAQVGRPAAAFVIRLRVEMLDVLSGKLDRDAAPSCGNGPAGHDVLVGFATIGVGLRKQR